ncbi:MAG: hypothetical protein MUF87_02340 [Anaerolineae bacterium]|nr:hypothetical protein [Anaerolineae bacterium]
MDLALLVTDPNFVYFALWIGLWMMVTTTHAPGTGVLEAMTFIALGITALLLLNMPTNWVAVLIFVGGVVGFIFLPFIKMQYLSLSLGGLVLQGIGGLFLFNGLQVSPIILGVTIVLSLIYHYFALRPGLLMIQSSQVQDRDSQLIGSPGRVVKALDPIGTVQANGELWTANSNKHLPSGTTIVVLERNGLQLYVEAVKEKREPEAIF